ncbi:MAG: zinc-ribbon domain-containing protein [Candidatus Binataceae bacterium]
MIDVQCTSCHTRYRIDERVLPEDTPTFKCSRCGHVFSTDPPARKPRLRIARRDSKPARDRRQPAHREPAAEQAPAEPDPPPASPDAAESASDTTAESDPPPPKPDTDELLNRTVDRDSGSAPSGENLTFDFRDEDSEPALGDDSEPDEPAPDFRREQWQVGDDAAVAPSPSPPSRTEPAISPHAPVNHAAHAAGAASAPPVTQPRFAVDHAYLTDDVALVERGAARSAGSFLALFAVLGIFFALLSLIICGEPVASARALNGMPGLGARFERPILPAMRVALLEVEAQYRTIKDGRRALLVTGVARNLSRAPLHTVQIAAGLLDQTERVLAGRATYCGINLSDKMLAEMTPREIDFLQRLEPQKNFVIASGASSRFLLVFTDPPTTARNMRIAVTKAAPPAQNAAPAS